MNSKLTANEIMQLKTAKEIFKEWWESQQQSRFQSFNKNKKIYAISKKLINLSNKII